MRKLKINRRDLELAFGLNSYEMNAYLDTETGVVLFIEADAANRLEDLLTDEATLEDILTMLRAQTNLSDTDLEQLMDAARVESDTGNRYLTIPKQDSQEGYRDMQEYIGSLEDEHLRELLDIAIQGSGAFRRFKDVLYRYPEAQEDWFKFRDACEQRRMLEWLTSEDVEPEFE